jgi:EAL domain-containing protein (putative c-di-GMP-specific phosphodiesterase class I)
MSGVNYAVLIGINSYIDQQNLPELKYAEKDARDLYEVLTHPKIGSFSKSNITLLTDKEATTNSIREVLYQEVTKRPTSKDTVLVYFSGHGFVLGEKPRAYLGTCDTNINTLLTRNPHAGLRMDELHDDIFMESKAKYVIFILDCCYSGAFMPSSIKGGFSEVVKSSQNSSLLNSNFFSTQSGRIALVSSPSDSQSYESATFQNSVFTHCLVEGLKGGAIDTNSGEVTLDSLIVYVKRHIPSGQIPGRYGQDYGTIVLTKPGQIPQENALSQGGITLIMSDDRNYTSNTLEVSSLSNPIDPYVPFIKNFLGLLSDKSSNGIPSSKNQILEAIRLASDASFIVVLRQSQNAWASRALSELDGDIQDHSKYIEGTLSKIQPLLSKEILFSRESYGFISNYEEENVQKSIVLIPLKTRNANDVIAICGLSSNSPLLGEIFCHILSAVYKATNELTKVNPVELEILIFDKLKQIYGFVPTDIYNRRFELFCERLAQMTVFFQPILYLSSKYLHIDSWEALARNPEHSSTPTDLFYAAELWGDQFMIELDTYFFRRAISIYTDTISKIPGRRRAEDVREISINVYPESLMRRAYFEALEEILVKEKLIQPEKVVLEISEKSPTPNLANSESYSLPSFRERLEEFVKRFSISFAIDDFGVGYSSIDRLVELNPVHVKVDRAILQQQAIRPTIEFLNQTLIKRYLRSPKIVIEGVDQTSPFSLAQLHKLGVRYIQGYIVGLPTSEPIRLTKEDKEELARLLK